MKKSPVVEEWRAETRRDDILRLLSLKFPGQVTADLVAAVGAQANLDELTRWLEAVVTSSSIREYRASAGI